MPIGEYADFDECVRKNSDKEDPKAYCGKIQAAVEASVTDFRVSTRITHTADLDAFEETEDGRMFAKIRIIKSGTSKNRRNYPPQVVKEAVDKKFWDGTLMFTNHDRKRPEVDERSFPEMVSAIESTSWDESAQAANGRVEFFDRPFFEKAKRAKDYIGVSINAVVKGTRRVVSGQTFEDVNSFHRSRSVDWVFNPAAGGAILAFEDEDDEDMIDWSKITIDDLRKNRADVVEAIEAEAKSEDDPPKNDPAKTDPPAAPVAMTAEQIQEAIKQGVQEGIKAEQDKAKAAEQRRNSVAEQVRQAFSKSGLPEKTRARVMSSFEGLEEYDEKKVAEAITAAQEELTAAGAGPVISGMGPSGAGSGTGDQKTFSIHESVKTSFGIGRTKTSDDPKKGD